MNRNPHPQMYSSKETYAHAHQPQSVTSDHQNYHMTAGYNGQQQQYNVVNGHAHDYSHAHDYGTAHHDYAALQHHHQANHGTVPSTQRNGSTTGNMTIHPSAQPQDGKGYTTSFYVNGTQPSTTNSHGPVAAPSNHNYQAQEQQRQQSHQQLQQHQQQQQQQQQQQHQQQQQQQQQFQQQQQLVQQQLHQQIHRHQQQQQRIQQQQQQQQQQQYQQQLLQQQQQQQQHKQQLQHHLQYQKTPQNDSSSEPIYQQPYAHPIPPPPSYPAPQPTHSSDYPNAGSHSNHPTSPNSLHHETQKLSNLSISHQNQNQTTNQSISNYVDGHPHSSATQNHSPRENHHHHHINRVSSDPRLYSIEDEDSLAANDSETPSTSKSPTSNPSAKSFIDPSRVVPILYEQKTFHVIPSPPPLVENVFAGRRDVRDPKSVPEKEIVSLKGTVRGFTNRVRAGIATFWAQPEDERNYRQLEKGKIVLYATSMSVVRETSEKCKSVRNILQNHMVRYEERDLYMSREIQQELKHRLAQDGIVTDEVTLPHIFADGIRLGGAGELERLNEAGELRALLDGYQKVNVRFACERCGGYRFVPCEFCHGSKRSLIRNHFTEDFFALRCMHCDDSGLRRCELCKEQQE